MGEEEEERENLSVWREEGKAEVVVTLSHEFKGRRCIPGCSLERRPPE